MPNYKYSAIDKSGKRIEANQVASSKDEVISMLRKNNLYPVKVEEDIQKQKSINFSDAFGKVGIKEISIFCRQFYTLLNAGITITSCLDILSMQTENKKLAKIIGEVHEDVQKGLTFSESLKKHKNIFPELLVNMIEAGEVSGNLDGIMDRMSVHFEKENKINNKIKSAMAYPIVLSCVALGVVGFLLTFIMPTFVGMFEESGVELPLPTRILMSISNFMQTYWYIVISGTAAMIYGMLRIFKSDVARIYIDTLKFKIPVLSGTTKKIITSRFTRTLSTLLASGVGLIQSLEIVSRVVGNKLVEKGINDAKEEVRKGIDLATPIKNIGIFPPMVTSMIKVGEQSGSLDDILEKTANFYDEEVETALQTMTTLIEPIMIVVMGVLVGGIVISIMLPMFDMMNTVQ